MKTQIYDYRLIVLLVALSGIWGCSGNKSMVSSQRDAPNEIVDSGYTQTAEKYANQSNIMVHPNKDQPSNLTLDALVRKLPGVRVTGRGAYSKVLVSGMASSFMADTSPLFVLNGRAIGTDFSQIYSIVNPNHVISMSVLKGSDATIYGTRGANGVILIRTK